MTKLIVLFVLFIVLFGCTSSKQCKVTSLGLPSSMIKEAKTWNKLNSAASVVWIDSCSYAERINASEWKIIIGEC